MKPTAKIYDIALARAKKEARILLTRKIATDKDFFPVKRILKVKPK